MRQAAFSDSSRPTVCVQGLGFVGAAMAVSVAAARDANGLPIFISLVILITPLRLKVWFKQKFSGYNN